jgi:hypothetical protein
MLAAHGLLRVGRSDFRGLSALGCIAKKRLYSSAHSHNTHARSKLELDPSLEALLKDVDISLQNYKTQHKHRELDVLEISEDLKDTELDEEPSEDEGYLGRKSPAAHFGSDKIGSMVIPHELQNAINELISSMVLPCNLSQVAN